MEVAMNNKYWKVQIEKTCAGIKAAITRSKRADNIPPDSYRHVPGILEAWTIWFSNKSDAEAAVQAARAGKI
jgi:hypothetical protein